MENCRQCSKNGCPFAYTEYSEQIQNYGCLPTPYDILYMRINHDKTWACHSNPNKPCLGGLQELKKRGKDYSTKELMTEDSDWHLYVNNNGYSLEVKTQEFKILQNELKSKEL